MFCNQLNSDRITSFLTKKCTFDFLPPVLSGPVQGSEGATMRALTGDSALANALGKRTRPVLHSFDGYFSFVKTLSPPRRFTVIWFFAASNEKTATPSIWNLSSAVASRGTPDDAPGG